MATQYGNIDPHTDEEDLGEEEEEEEGVEEQVQQQPLPPFPKCNFRLIKWLLCKIFFFPCKDNYVQFYLDQTIKLCIVVVCLINKNDNLLKLSNSPTRIR